MDPVPELELTANVKLCVALGETPLLAVIVSEYVPPVPTAGVPPSVAVPFPLFVKVTPLGRAPDSLSDGVGDPVVVTVKLPAVPTANVVLFALVMLGAVPWFTVNVKLWVAAVPTPLLAVRVREYVPPVPAAGVPPSVAVPFPLFVKVTPLGRVPDSLSAGVGDPVVVTVKLPAVPTVNVVLFALVIAGAVPPELPLGLKAAITAAPRVLPDGVQVGLMALKPASTK